SSEKHYGIMNLEYDSIGFGESNKYENVYENTQKQTSVDSEGLKFNDELGGIGERKTIYGINKWIMDNSQAGGTRSYDVVEMGLGDIRSDPSFLNHESYENKFHFKSNQGFDFNSKVDFNDNVDMKGHILVVGIVK